MEINHEQLLMQDMMLYVVSQPTKSGYFFLEQHRRQNLDFFFLEHAGELRIFVLREEKEWSNYKSQHHTCSWFLYPDFYIQTKSGYKTQLVRG